MNAKMLWQYARLVVEVGVNLQKGQPVMINCPVDCAPFARMLTTAAYDVGAKDVIINWRDDYCAREHWLKADDSVFDSVDPWVVLQRNTLAKEGVGCISVSASDPENLRGVDPSRLRRANTAAGRDLKEFSRMMMSNALPWCVVSVPIPAWAKKVFPGLSAEEAVDKLWDEIFKAVRITEDGDAVAEWRAHCANIEGKAKALTEYDFAELHYKNSLGTDLRVKMPENHLWLAGGDICKTNGVKFVANMPTEEVFSAPLRTGVDGTLAASKPLVLNGNVVEGIRFTFKDGRIDEIHADTNEETLRTQVGLDEGSHYLGEIALVPYDSPISNSGILFFNTLFDENASCHFAFGEAYPACIKGGDDLSVEELKAAGINAESNTHVDFMVGTRDLEITGTTRDGRVIKVFENGNFAI
ncbi:MAG: aminopeptidase [Clostridiales bacterium]|nr:aminopeptidase [Clostridiales bacterium]